VNGVRAARGTRAARRGADAERTGPRIRPRSEEDAAACARVLARVHRADGYPVHWPDRPGDWLSPPQPLGAWVAEPDEGVVGHVALSRGGEGDLAPGVWGARHGTETATAVVGRLFVDPGARGHGLGALLLGRAEREARARGLHPVLDVVATDTAATALYERLGWQRMATVEQRWGPSTRVTVHCYAAAP
jgi:GNAT superfamily N-acetyltransferase